MKNIIQLETFTGDVYQLSASLKSKQPQGFVELHHKFGFEYKKYLRKY
jgi:hypothetical protein